MNKLGISLFLLLSSSSFAYAQTKTLTFCAYDYMENCSDYPITSVAARQCMADVGIDLSPNCVNALIADGFLTKEQVISYAAKKGITVVEGPNGLAKVDKKPETVTAQEQTAIPVEVIIPEKKEEVVAAKEPEQEEVGKSTKETVKKAYTKAKETVKKTYQKAKKAVKDYTAKNKAYASKSNIEEQNKLRKKEIDNRNIVADGINADFGRYEPREKGYTRNRFKYDFKTHIQENTHGISRTGGINAQF